MTDELVAVPGVHSLSTKAIRVRNAMWVVLATGVGAAVSLPILVAILKSTGALRPGQYYPDAWAWTTAFTVAFAVTISLNALIWIRVIPIIDGEGAKARRSAFVAATIILLAIGSFVVVSVLAAIGIVVYFQFPVTY